MMSEDEALHPAQWVGRTEETTGLLRPEAVQGLAATLDRAQAPLEGERLPPLWHWMFFQPMARQSELEFDGHPPRGSFLPPVRLPRRMWAGGALRFEPGVDLIVGATASRRSRIDSVICKSGRSGPLVFVAVEHAISDALGRLAITERQELVYRGDAPRLNEPPSPEAAITHPPPVWRRRIDPSPVLLFRYSALTFNGHRIHYDRPYAMTVENYAGLVVHGPLIATLLLELLQTAQPQARVSSFEYRASAPLFDDAPFFTCGRPAGEGIELWAQSSSGRVAMSANVTLNAS
jgi:3-methylfumaryl-CoA hydratase